MGADPSADEAPPTGEEWFRWLPELLPQLIWTCRGDGPCDYLSPQWVRYTGIPAQDQLGYAWLDQLHPEDRPRVQQAWAAIAPSGRQFDIEFRIRRYDSVYRWFKTRATPLRNAAGVVVKWFGSNTDIQDLRDAESALRQVNRDLEGRVRERTEALATATASAQSTAAQLLAAQRMAKLGSWHLDLTSGQVEWSEQLFRTMGLEPSAGAPSYPDQVHLFTPDSWRRLGAAIEEAVRTGVGYELELEVNRPDGTRRWCVARAETGRDADGRVRTLTGTFHDVTELKEVQQALEKATERMQLATASAQIGVWDWNMVTNALSWDPIMHQLYGMDPSSFNASYEAWRACVHPDDVAAAEKALEVAFEGGAPFDTGFRIIRRTGGVVRHLRGAAVVHRDDMGRPDRMVGVNWDVTEQREMEQALLANERLLREFVTHAPAAIAMLDRDMRYIQASERWLQDYRLVGQDIIGRSHYEVFPDLPEHWREVHQRVLRGAIETCDEDPFPRADGHLEWLQWEARPWLTPSGEVGGLLFFTQLITARKQLEGELQRQKEALERSNTELKQFAYVASHDLQEPLRAVAGCSQLLARRYTGQLDAQADELIRHIVEGSDRMHLLIRDLLAYSRVDQQELKVARTDASEALRTALVNLRAAISETAAEVTHDKLPIVTADHGQLVQLFQNIVGNAIKYHGPELPRVHIDVTRHEASWEFRIRDNGIGIEPQYFDRIFNLFQRLHTRIEYPGTGIGLAICKKIVQRHRGRIWVEPAPGGGSIFCFTLPSPSRGTHEQTPSAD